MIKAGALLYAMFLVVIVSIISSSFILVNYYNKSYVIHALKSEELFRDANSGINYGLAMHQQLPLDVAVDIDLYDDEKSIVKLEKTSWGAFYILTTIASWKNKSATKSALVGANINSGEKVALYLSDQNKPLSITGETKITGDCYLPKSGVRRAYIEGKSFVGNKLINGQKRNSNKELPSINENLIHQNLQMLSYINIKKDSVIDYEVLFEVDSIINSFQNKTLVLYSPYNITIRDKVIKGNVIIKSDQNVVIKESSDISNIIVYAKGIKVEEKTIGEFQLFAEDSIHIAADCNLKYPSVVAVLNSKMNNENCKIFIGEKVNLKGSIFLYQSSNKSKIKSIVRIGEEAIIMGQVYASEELELKGAVKGGIFCSNFLLKTPSSIYENHLIDAIIDRSALPDEFVGVALTEEINNHQIIQWLN